MIEESAIIAVYDTCSLAEDTIDELERSGFDMTKVSILGKGQHPAEQSVELGTTDDGMRWGGRRLMGLFFGAAFLWIPDIGPIDAAGPVVGLLVGALNDGSVMDGLSAMGAALAALGVPKNHIVRYETELRADKSLVIAHGGLTEARQARAIMARHQASDAGVVVARSRREGRRGRSATVSRPPK